MSKPPLKQRLAARAKQLKTELPAVALALRDARTPWTAKALGMLTIAYALSPIDLVPDFIPVLGYLDDLLILPLLVALTVRLLPAEVLDDCRKQAEGMWQNGKPKHWYYALPIILLWLIVLVLIVKAVWPSIG